MSSAGENIQTTGAENNQDLTPDFSYSELVAEIAAMIGGPARREPGWVDRLQMAKQWSVSIYTAEQRLSKAVDDGRLETALVCDPARHNQTVRVWRKVR